MAGKVSKVFVFFVILLVWVSAFALDVIYLENGTEVAGYIVAWSVDKTMVYFQPEDKTEEPYWISISDIERIDFGAHVVHKFDGNESRKDGNHQLVYP